VNEFKSPQEETKSPEFRENEPSKNVKFINIMHNARAIAD